MGASREIKETLVFAWRSLRVFVSMVMNGIGTVRMWIDFFRLLLYFAILSVHFLAAYVAYKDDAAILRGVPYGNLPDQTADVYIPRAHQGGALPVVLFVPGGAFVSAIKFQSTLIHRRLADTAPCLVFAVGYRCYPEVQLEASLGDVSAAVRWVLGVAADYGGDPRRVFVCGHSAGSYLGLMSVYRLVRDLWTEGQPPRKDSAESEQSSLCPCQVDVFVNRPYRILGLFGLSGVASLELQAALFKARGWKPDFLEILAGVSRDGGSGSWHESSLVDQLDPLLCRILPPVFLFHGRRDKLVPFRHSASLAGRFAFLLDQSTILATRPGYVRSNNAAVEADTSTEGPPVHSCRVNQPLLFAFECGHDALVFMWPLMGYDPLTPLLGALMRFLQSSPQAAESLPPASLPTMPRIVLRRSSKLMDTTLLEVLRVGPDLAKAAGVSGIAVPSPGSSDSAAGVHSLLLVSNMSGGEAGLLPSLLAVRSRPGLSSAPWGPALIPVFEGADIVSEREKDREPSRFLVPFVLAGQVNPT